jgi:hypothetical protein
MDQEAITQRIRESSVGMRPHDPPFPRDFAVFLRFHRDLAAIAERSPMPDPLTLAQLDAFLARAGHRFRVRWVEGGIDADAHPA